MKNNGQIIGGNFNHHIRYSGLYSLSLRVVSIQPMAPAATLELLAQAIDSGQTAIEVAAASVRDVKRNWNLP